MEHNWEKIRFYLLKDIWQHLKTNLTSKTHILVVTTRKVRSWKQLDLASSENYETKFSFAVT